jgi:hypothetical protein
MITLTFPSDYTLAYPPICVSLFINNVAVYGFTCTTAYNSVRIQGAIPVSSYIYNV